MKFIMIALFIFLTGCASTSNRDEEIIDHLRSLREETLMLRISLDDLKSDIRAWKNGEEESDSIRLGHILLIKESDPKNSEKLD